MKRLRCFSKTSRPAIGSAQMLTRSATTSGSVQRMPTETKAESSVALGRNRTGPLSHSLRFAESWIASLAPTSLVEYQLLGELTASASA